jgi:GNAT superfamily N-acetyltransferase
VIQRLEPALHERVRPLFDPLRFHLASAAVLDGVCPGQVFVDDPGEPRAAFMVSPEGCYLAGNPEVEGFNRGFKRALASGRLLPEGVGVLFLVVHPEDWRDQLAKLLSPATCETTDRYHYTCRAVGHDWRAALPEGCLARRIDRALLEEMGEALPDHVAGWMRGNWGSTDAFLRSGVGTLTTCGGEVVSWSLADCASGRGCEIGIRTVASHRRRGLGTVTASANAELALSLGFEVVGWHCPQENVGSIRTAEKVGFRLERCYTAYFARLA